MTDQAHMDENGQGSQPEGEVIQTTQSRVSCNCGGGALGNPKIWLNMNADGEVTCPYCSRHFVQIKE